MEWHSLVLDHKGDATSYNASGVLRFGAWIANAMGDEYAVLAWTEWRKYNYRYWQLQNRLKGRNQPYRTKLSAPLPKHETLRNTTDLLILADKAYAKRVKTRAPRQQVAHSAAPIPVAHQEWLDDLDAERGRHELIAAMAPYLR
jgi:hypothetical protein